MKNSVKKEIEEIIKIEKLNCSIEDFKNKVNWYWVSRDQDLSEEFIREFKNYVDWHSINLRYNITKKDIEEYEKKIKIEKSRVKNKFQLIRF